MQLSTLLACKQGRQVAVGALAITTSYSFVSLIRCLYLVAAWGLTPRLVLLTLVAAVAFCAHGWTLVTVIRPSEVCNITNHCNCLPCPDEQHMHSTELIDMHLQVWRQESVKSSNSLVEATACMMGGILSHQVLNEPTFSDARMQQHRPICI